MLRITKRALSLFLAIGVCVTIRSCTDEINKEKNRPQPPHIEKQELIEAKITTKEGYIVDSNFDLLENEEIVEIPRKR